jgi:Zn-dependent peptidase ImmA (M78 family)
MINLIDERARSTARHLREDLHISDETKINLDSIIDSLNISFKKADLGEGILGACKVLGLKKLIVIRPDFNSVHQERFTIAHELGHILIHYGSHYCKKENFNMWRSASDKESEANAFAAELLLPQRAMINILSKKDISISMIKNVAEHYQTSMSATAIRLVKIYNDSAIAVWHKDRKIIWKVKSPECYFELSECSVSPSSMIRKVNSDSVFAKGYVDPFIWIEDKRDNLKCYEETLYFRNLNAYLTILKFIKLDD